jgi:dTDP-4-dehydrorhamnose 3,5-epimerase
MEFTSLGGSDAKIIHSTVHGDERGSFARVWCADLFKAAGIDFVPAQGNSSTTRRRGALRGMHFQRSPHPDAKLVRCSRGRIHDIIVDLRQDSKTQGRVYHTELEADSGKMIYIPPGFAHGFQTLSDNVSMEYLMGTAYVPDLYDGFCYDDPYVSIEWPELVTDISDKDRSWPALAGRLPWHKAALV